MTPNKPSFLQRLGARIIFLGISAISATVRYRLEAGVDAMAHIKGPAVYCTWHNRLALCLPIYWRYVNKRSRTKGLAAMASASRDGAFLSAIIGCFKVHAVRGSSSRRGPQALLELTSWAERGYDLAITPDGPRGPCYHLQPGAVSLAQITGMPIVSMVFNLSWKIKVKSWDRFQIPLPFSRCDIHITNPVQVPRDASDADREAIRARIEKELRAITLD